MTSGTGKRNSPFILADITVVLMLGVLGSSLTGCGSSETEPAASTTPSEASAAPTATSPVPAPTSAPPPVAAPAPVPPAPDPSNCTPANPDVVAQIEGQLGNELTLMDTFQLDSAQSGYLYVGGNIMEGERKLSSSDVWLARDGLVTYALSGTAREMTPLADGRDLGLSAGDEFGAALQECINVAERTRNAGGN